MRIVTVPGIGFSFFALGCSVVYFYKTECAETGILKVPIMLPWHCSVAFSDDSEVFGFFHSLYSVVPFEN